MKNFAFILLCICFVTIESCKTSESNYIGEFKSLHRFNFPKIDNQSNVISQVQNLIIGDKNCVGFLDYNTGTYFIYNLSNNELVKKINLNLVLGQQTFSVEYLSDDSIFVLINPGSSEENYYHDTTLFLVNSQKKINKVFDMSQTNTILKSGKIDMKNVQYLGDALANDFYMRDKLFLTFTRYESAAGDEDFVNSPQEITGYLDNSGNFVKIPVYFPSKKGEYMPRNFEGFQVALTPEEKLVYSFPHTKGGYIYDLKKQKLTYKSMPTYISDTIHFLKKYMPMVERPNNDYSQGMYANIFYDAFRKNYYRFFVLPTDNVASRFFSMSIFDSTFVKKGEVILEKGYVPVMFFDKKGAYIFNQQHSQDVDSIVFDKFDLIFRPIEKSQILSKVDSLRALYESQNILTFLNKKHQKSFVDAPQSLIMHIPVGYSCEPCVNEIIEKYKHYRFTKKSDNIFLLLSFQSKNAFELFTKEHFVDLQDKNLMIEYANQNQVFKTPNADLYLVAKGKILYETKLNPSDLKIIDQLAGR